MPLLAPALRTALLAPLLLLTGCGGEAVPASAAASPGASAARPSLPPLPSAFTGEPLADPFLGVWREPVGSGGGPYLWTFAPAGSPECAEVARATTSCYVVRSEGEAEPEDWGEALLQDGVLVTRQLGGIEAAAQCIGQVSVFRLTVDGTVVGAGLASGTTAAVEKGGCRVGDRNYFTKRTMTRVS